MTSSERTLNQLLVEMDGFESNESVILIAATNRADILDPALLRPGRFDRQIVVDAPDVRGRERILQVHAKDKPIGSDVDLKRIAQLTPGFTGADLMNLMNESALLTARRGKKIITMREVNESMERVIAGPERKGRVMDEAIKLPTTRAAMPSWVTSFRMPTRCTRFRSSLVVARSATPCPSLRRTRC